MKDFTITTFKISKASICWGNIQLLDTGDKFQVKFFLLLFLDI